MKPSSFPSSVITRVFPATWFSKFKQIGGGRVEAKQPRGKLDFPTGNRREAKFYSLDNDPYWTLSFRKKRVNLNLPPPDYEDDFQVAVSSFGKNEKPKRRRSRSKTERKRKSEVAAETEKTEEFEVSRYHRNVDFRRHSLSSIEEEDYEEEDEDIADLDRDGSSSPTSERASNSQSRNSEENEKFEELKIESVYTRRRSRSRKTKRNKMRAHTSKSKTKKEAKEEESDEIADLDSNRSSSARISISQSQNLEENEKFEELKAESAYTRRRSRRRKTKRKEKIAHTSKSKLKKEAKEEEGDEIADLDRNRSSSATSARISISQSQNLEENEKFDELKAESAYTRRRSPRNLHTSKSKLKKEVKEEEREGSTIYGSFAVMKSSFNPQQDFRDSMVEMINEEGITRREELEELLACYLTLNCDGHHYLIINAFQQVWSEINGRRGSE